MSLFDSTGQPLGGRSARRTRRRGRALVWRIAVTAGAFVAVLGLTAGAVAAIAYTKYNGQITRVHGVINTKDTSIRDAPVQQHAANFLVIGSDTRAGADAKFGNVAGARSDTTILVHISPDRSRATVISIPRDSWVDIPPCTDANGHVVPEHSEMFNSAFTIGGAKCTIATVQKLTGIAVTHFVEIDFSGFESMVSAIGHVTICSPQDVFDPGSGLRLHIGDNRLDGTQALAYVRARETLGDGSDLGRIKRQQLFLGAVMRQATSGALLSSPARLTRFLDAVTKAITVDSATSFSDLRTLAQSMQGLDPRHVVFYTAPIANRDYSPPGTSMTGRVLLDAVKGRSLYDAVIHDVKPVLVTKGATPTPTPTAPTSSAPAAAPPDGTTAAQASCAL
jgi:LCP family protein required for cell wall assembly